MISARTARRIAARAAIKELKKLAPVRRATRLLLLKYVCSLLVLITIGFAAITAGTAVQLTQDEACDPCTFAGSTLTLAAGSNRIVYLAIGYHDTSQMTAACTFGGNAMTQVLDEWGTTGATATGVAIHYILEASLPANGARSFSCNTTPNIDRILAVAGQIDGAKQQAPTIFNYVKQASGTSNGVALTAVPIGSFVLHAVSYPTDKSASDVATAPATIIGSYATSGPGRSLTVTKTITTSTADYTPTVTWTGAEVTLGGAVAFEEVDTTAPVPGNSGAISTSNITETTIDLTVTAATDDHSSAANLQYEFRQSSTNNMGSVANAEANGTIIRAYTANDVTHTATGLTAGTTYWFQVIVKDETGNKAIYTQEDETTTKPIISDAGSFTGFWPGVFEIQSISLPDGLEEAAYAGAQFVALNGKAPHTWTVSVGSLPTGMSLSSAGALTGTPAAGQSGTHNFTVQAEDDNGGKASRAVSLTVQDSGGGTLSFYEDAEDGNLTANPAWTSAGGCSSTANSFMEGNDEVAKTTSTDCVLFDNVNLAQVYFGFDIYRDGTAAPDTNRDEVLIGLGSSDEELFSIRVETDWDIFGKTPGQTAESGRGFRLSDDGEWLLDAESRYIECHYAKGTGANATFRCRVDGGTIQEFFTGTATVNVDRIILRDENDDAAQNFFFDRVEAKDDDWPGRGVLVPPGPPPADDPWERLFTAARIHYVSPSGSGDGLAYGTPESITTAISHCLAGDLHWLLAGTYGSTYTITCDGNGVTSSGPIVWKAFIDSNGDPEKAKFTHGINVDGDWNWVWAVFCGENTDETASNACIRLRAPGTRIINSIVQDYKPHTGIEMFNFGPDMVLYGTASINNGAASADPGEHGLYMQNSASFGTKYFIQPILLDYTTAEAEHRWNFHAYTQGNSVRNMHTQDGVIQKGRVIVQKENYANENADNIVFKNVLFDSINIGLKLDIGNPNGMPAQFQITDSTLRNTLLSAQGTLGVGDTCIGAYPPATKFTGNKVWSPNGGVYIDYRTRIHNGTCNGTTTSVKIRDLDEWNNNTYGPSGAGNTFKINANGSALTGRTLAQWSSDSDAARETAGGTAFDASSTEGALPTVDEIHCFDNFYEIGWGYCWGIDWDGSGAITITGTEADKVIANGKQYDVRNYRDFYGTPIVNNGTYTLGAGLGAITLPTSPASKAAVNSVLIVGITSQP